MSLTSWFTGTKQKRDSAPNKQQHRPRRQPTRSRPTLESLEQRALLDAAGGQVAGAFHNLSLNSNFNAASNGNVLPIPGFSNFGTSGIANGANPQHALTFTGLANSEVGAQAASSTFLAQDQLYSQFRLFAVNSQGPDIQREQQQLTNFLVPSFGFGSGTWPNRPWMPAAYNVGLANHQFAYSSQADHGFASVPPNAYPQPGTVPIAQSRPKQQQKRLDDEDGKAIKQPEQVLEQKAKLEQEETPQKRTNKDINDQNEDVKPVKEESPAEKERPADQILERDVSLPNSLWLSVLAPAPVTALVAGLPGDAAEAEGGDMGVEAAE